MLLLCSLFIGLRLRWLLIQVVLILSTVLFRLLNELKHSQRHLDFLLDLELESLDITHHLIDLFKDLLALFLAFRSLITIAFKKVSDGTGAVQFDHLLLQGFESVHFVDHCIYWLAVLQAGLREEQKKWQTETGSFLYLNDAGAHAHLDNLLDELAAYGEDLVN